MKNRRSLVEGLSETPPVDAIERSFVYGQKADNLKEPDEPPAPASQPKPDRSVLPQFTGRVPMTTRCRPELASMLKRASLERQLQGIEPSSMQDIMEIAMEQWLKENGYLD